MLDKIDRHLTQQSFEEGHPHPCHGGGLCRMSVVVDCPRGSTAGGQGSIGPSDLQGVLAHWVMWQLVMHRVAGVN
uniref:Uncharacterized protein n=1 Tax=Romanomermis culicivorax TaxID=13658 RepID=A0A915J195_ROMCU